MTAAEDWKAERGAEKQTLSLLLPEGHKPL
jgi:hypothetical protein